MVKRAPSRRRPRKAKPGTKGLAPAECKLEEISETAVAANEAISKAGGWLVGSYKEPLAGHALEVRRVPVTDNLEPLERLQVRIQGIGADSPIQSDSKAGEFLEKPFLQSF